MSRVAATRIGLAILLLLVAALIWWSRLATIGEEQAGIIADALFQTYVSETGEVPVHFTGPQTISFEDGWEYRWVYEPCRETAELRIFVSSRGRARFGTTPDCAPIRGFPVPPQEV
ncbi:MAG: hypothetical protein ACK4MX_04070 [Thermaurantiacus sp.]